MYWRGTLSTRHVHTFSACSEPDVWMRMGGGSHVTLDARPGREVLLKMGLIGGAHRGPLCTPSEQTLVSKYAIKSSQQALALAQADIQSVVRRCHGAPVVDQIGHSS
jgi:hypothetical protein